MTHRSENSSPKWRLKSDVERVCQRGMETKLKSSASMAPPMGAVKKRRLPELPSNFGVLRSSVVPPFPSPWLSCASFLFLLAHLTPSVDCQGAVSISVGVGGRNSDASGGSVPPPPATVAPVSQISQVGLICILVKQTIKAKFLLLYFFKSLSSISLSRYPVPH